MVPFAATTERRAMPRPKTLFKGRILFANKLASLDCTVRNMSAAGARLVVAKGHLAPATFDIVLPQQNQTLRARTVWRSEDSVGVSFDHPEAAAAPNTDPLRKLESENTHLRKLVRTLRGRLEAKGEAVD